MGSDRIIRIWRCATGKLYRVYDESLAVVQKNQKVPRLPLLATCRATIYFSSLLDTCYLLATWYCVLQVAAFVVCPRIGVLLPFTYLHSTQEGGPLFQLEEIDFGRRMAIERELMNNPTAPPSNVIFDESSNFILYPTLLGIKCTRFLCVLHPPLPRQTYSRMTWTVVNIHTNKLIKILGKVENTERFLGISLYQVLPCHSPHL